MGDVNESTLIPHKIVKINKSDAYNTTKLRFDKYLYHNFVMFQRRMLKKVDEFDYLSILGGAHCRKVVFLV